MQSECAVLYTCQTASSVNDVSDAAHSCMLLRRRLSGSDLIIWTKSRLYESLFHITMHRGSTSSCTEISRYYTLANGLICQWTWFQE